MTLDPLPRDATAIVVVELQNDLVHPSLVGQKGLSGKLAEAVQERGVLPRLAELLTQCREAGVPVLYATKERHPNIPLPSHMRIYKVAVGTPKLVHGTWGAEVVEDIAPQKDDIMLPRYTSIDPSHGSEIWSLLQNLKTQTLIVAGISTTMAVEGLVRAAANRGFRIVVVEDCCASFPEQWHRFSADNILPLIADVVPAAEVVAALS
ncbi:MAG: isochorismatase family cysteine hydrolase [Actinomycetota bacterium]